MCYGKLFGKRVLRGVDVLVLVYIDITELPLVLGEDVGMLVKKPYCLREQIVKIKGVGITEFLLICDIGLMECAREKLA